MKDDPHQAEYLMGDLIRRVFDWQHNVSGPLSKLFVTSPQCTYDFARKTFQKSFLMDGPVDDAINSSGQLHYELIMAASTQILDLLREAPDSIGSQTFKEIQGWFRTINEEATKQGHSIFTPDILPYVMQMNSDWVTLQPHCLDNIESNQGNEYPFFSAKILHLYIAHLVYVTEVDPHYTGDRACKEPFDIIDQSLGTYTPVTQNNVSGPPTEIVTDAGSGESILGTPKSAHSYDSGTISTTFGASDSPSLTDSEHASEDAKDSWATSCSDMLSSLFETDSWGLPNRSTQQRSLPLLGSKSFHAKLIHYEIPAVHQLHKSLMREMISRFEGRAISMNRDPSPYERHQMAIFRRWASELIMPILEHRISAVQNNESTRASERSNTLVKKNRHRDVNLPTLFHDDSFLGVLSYATIVRERSKYFTHRPKAADSPQKRRRMMAKKLCMSVSV